MSVIQGVVTDRLDQILGESIRDHTPMTLTWRTAQGWCMIKARFVSGSKADGELVVQSLPPADGSTTPEPPVGETVGMTFRVGHRKCMTSSPIRSVRRQPDGLVISCGWLEQVQQLQRRVFERAEPPRDTVVAVRFWAEEFGTESSAFDRVVKHGQLEDLSAGGMRIKAAETIDVMVGMTYRCVFTPRSGAPAFVLDATLRHREAGDKGRLSLGFQLIGMETSTEGRKTLERLARLVSQYHRSAGRRHHARRGDSGEQEG